MGRPKNVAGCKEKYHAEDNNAQHYHPAAPKTIYGGIDQLDGRREQDESTER